MACAACGTVCGVPVQELRDDNAIDSLNLDESGLGVIGAVLLGLMLPALRSVRSLRCRSYHDRVESLLLRCSQTRLYRMHYRQRFSPNSAGF